MGKYFGPRRHSCVPDHYLCQADFQRNQISGRRLIRIRIHRNHRGGRIIARSHATWKINKNICTANWHKSQQINIWFLNEFNWNWIIQISFLINKNFKFNFYEFSGKLNRVALINPLWRNLIAIKVWPAFFLCRFLRPNFHPRDATGPTLLSGGGALQ